MNRLRKVISLVLIVAVMATITLVGGTMLTPAAAGTGTGLSEHVLNAYYSNWSYVYGAMSTGAVDCSGLIYMYSRSGSRVDMMGSSPQTGSVYNGIPNIHGLGLYQPGHVGVYVGNGMAVDARSEYYGICYQSAYSKNWTNWFKVAGVSYPTTGWEYFNGNYYYYENGEYLTDTYITVDGVSYYLDSSGKSSSTPGDPDSTADSSSSSSGSSSSSSSSTESKYLKVGSYGDKVTELQYRLTALGFYNGDITGYYGEMTEAAYKAFQKAAGLYADGIAGEDELDLLYSDDAPTGSVAEVGTSASTSTSQDTTDDTTDTDDTAEAEVEEGFTSTITTGTSDFNVFLIQTELTALGYFEEEISGYYGEVTQSAVLKFQAENGLPTTGDVDEETYNLIFSENALANPYTEDEGDKNVVYNPNSTETAEDATEEATKTTSPTQATDIALQSAQMASKALEGINLDTKATSDNNGSFIVWLIVMIAFMSVAFWFVFSSEKKKKKARYDRIKARANRSW